MLFRDATATDVGSVLARELCPRSDSREAEISADGTAHKRQQRCDSSAGTTRQAFLAWQISIHLNLYPPALADLHQAILMRGLEVRADAAGLQLLRCGSIPPHAMFSMLRKVEMYSALMPPGKLALDRRLQLLSATERNAL